MIPGKARGKMMIAVYCLLSAFVLQSCDEVLTVCWDAPPDEVSGYRLYMKSGSDDDYSQVWETQETCCEVYYGFLEPDTLYTFVVTAYNDDGESLYSNTLDYYFGQESIDAGASVSSSY